jgi:serine phosphatase RsbU (regulator of sigma subunit)
MSADKDATGADKTATPTSDSNILPARGSLATISQIRNFLRNEPELWAQHDDRNRWFCPHCGDVISTISLPPGGGFLLLQDCPHQILEHLKVCQAVAAGRAAEKYFAKAGTSGEIRSMMHKARMSQRHTLRPVPEVPGFELGCLYRPMDAIGGDFYEFVHLPDGRMGMAIGDPSGHGVEACMVMAVTKKLISMYGRSGLKPADCLAAVNCELYDDVIDGAFVSAFYGVLDPQARTFSYSRAGHNPPILFNPARDPKAQLIMSNGIALGVDQGQNFNSHIEEKTLALQDGDLLVLYTDGMTEAHDDKGKELDTDGLIALLQKFYDRGIEDLTNQIWYQVEKLFKSTGQQDDMTMIVLRVLKQ